MANPGSYYDPNSKKYYTPAGSNLYKEIAAGTPIPDYNNAATLPGGAITIPVGAVVDQGSGGTPNAGDSRVPRYTLDDVLGGSGGTLGKAKADLFGAGGIYGDRAPVTPQDEAKIRADQMTKAQAQIDSINEIYNQMVGTANVQGENRLGQGRAVAARSGLLGSTIYESGQKPQTEKYNADVVSSINAERQNRLAAVFGNIDARADQQIQAEKARKAGNADAYIKYLSDAQGGAREDIKNLAASGVALDKIESLYTEDYQKLLDQTGFSKTGLAAFFAANAPKAQIDGFNTKIEGNKIVTTWYDKTTGKVHSDIKDLGTDAGNFNHSQYDANTGDVVLWNDKGESKVLKATEGKPDTSKLDNAYKQAQIDKIRNDISKMNVTEGKKKDIESMASAISGVTGGDGFVSPPDYKYAKDQWVKGGYSADEFDRIFSNYRNPNDVYPTVKTPSNVVIIPGVTD